MLMLMLMQWTIY